MRRPPLLMYKKGWPLWQNPYRPLAEIPHLYEEFAAVGKKVMEAWLVVKQLKKKDLPMVTGFGNYDWAATPARFPEAGYAAYIPALQRQALRFVQDYGPLDFPAPTPQGAPLPDFLIEATALYVTMTVAQGLQDADIQQPEEGLLTAQGLARELNSRLSGVNPCVRLDELQLVPSFTCDSLLTAMWLQFYEALAQGRSWRHCKGCKRLFTQGRAGQEFHDSGCRNRYHVRRFAHKDKSPRKGDIHDTQAR